MELWKLREWSNDDFNKWLEVYKHGGKIKEAQDLINSVHTINLTGNRIGAKGMKSLADALKINSTVHTINLRNRIGAEGMKSLADALKINSTVHTINLDDNGIGAEGMKSLADALKINSTIHTINLRNRIGDEGMKSLANALKINSTVHTIDLGFIGIGDEGMKSLADALKTNSTVHTINLVYSGIGNKGMKSLADALKTNSTVHTMDLRYNWNLFSDNGIGIGDEGMKSLASCLKTQLDDDKLKLSLTTLDGINLSKKCCRTIFQLDDSFQNKSNEDILKYLKELKEGITEIYRARLVLVGAGYVGKTTLVSRLKGEDFVAERNMTNGIDISEIKLNTQDNKEVTFTAFDFAGQEDYIHTHALFFQKDSIFLVLHKHDGINPDNIAKTERELENFLRMIESCAINVRVVFTLTHCEDKKMCWDKERMKKLIDDHPKLSFVIEPTGKPFEIDSKSGAGIDNLKKTILKEAMRNEKVKTKVPSSFFELKEALGKENRFSITESEFNRVAKTFLAEDMIRLALDLFISWGIVYILSNKDIVLKPQKLADVLSCLFTKEDTTLAQLRSYISLWAGYLKHDSVILDAIWGKRNKDGQYEYPRELWSPTKGKSTPFLDILHESGLAYPIYDSNGTPLDCSVVPAMLPSSPTKFGNFLSMKEKDMFQALFSKDDICEYIHPTIDISFHPCLPPTLIGQLQSRVSYLALNGGAWRFGCSLQFNDAKSGAIFFLSPTDDSTIRLVSGGSDSSKTDARDAVVLAIHNLIKDKFDSLVCTVDEVNETVEKSGPVVSKPKRANPFRRLYDYTKNKKNTSSSDQKSNIIDKNGYSISFLSKSTTSTNPLKGMKDSIRNLNEKIDDTMQSMSHALWAAIPDLNEVTIGQTVNSEFKVEGLWLVFKDDGSSNFHALHFNYKDGHDNTSTTDNTVPWDYDGIYEDIASNTKNTSITFKSSSTNIVSDENSKITLGILKRLFGDKYNITLPSIIKSKDKWASLVSIKLDDSIAEKLWLFQKANYPLTHVVNTTDSVIRIIHKDQQACLLARSTVKNIVNVVKEEAQITRKEMNQNFQSLYENLTLFTSSKDRSHPTTFVVFTAEKGTKEKTKDSVKKVTEAMYAVLNKESNLSTALSTFLHNKVCDLYLICEECNQIEGDPYVITSPKEKVAKFLPLASLGISVLDTTNNIGSMSGLPIPDITNILEPCKSFLEKIKIDKGRELAKIQDQFLNSNNSGKKQNCDTYFAEQFGLFLDNMDKDHRRSWKDILNKKLVDRDNKMEHLFICKSCAIRHFVSFESTGHNENYDDSSNVSVVISNSSKCCNGCTIV